MTISPVTVDLQVGRIKGLKLVASTPQRINQLGAALTGGVSGLLSALSTPLVLPSGLLPTAQQSRRVIGDHPQSCPPR